MKKLSLVLRLLLAAILLTVIATAFAQSSMSSWPFILEVIPPQAAPGDYDLVLPLQVMDKSRTDLTDLRLYDSHGREIPYALRIRREVNTDQLRAVSVFNQARIGSASEASVDLGENPGEHNELEIDTSGVNFRRRVDVEGSENGKDWRTLETGAVIFSFAGQYRTADSNRISYPASRFRFLRVRLFADELSDKEVPVISGVRVLKVVREPGVLTTWNTVVPFYQLLRSQGAPASSWTIDLGGRVPLDRLMLEVADASFSRSFQLEEVSDPQNIRLLTSGELTRRTGEAAEPLVIRMEREEYAHKLRLVINDYSNQTLTLTSITAGAPARQLIFELKEPDGQPLRLFFGNPNAIAPHYDFEKQLPRSLVATPSRSAFGAVINNPDYQPEPLPFTERISWLIYLVLGAASLALAMILISLARTTVRTKEAGSG
jgi:Protein of unknown function (DUF3999)